MKQSEKLDIILRGLYLHKDKYQTIGEILNSNGIEASLEEKWQLVHRLRDDNFVTDPFSSNGDPACKINTYGIEYCEESSYTYKGQSLITNNYTISISDSPNASIVSNSQNVSITINNYTEVKDKIVELREAIDLNKEIDSRRRQDLLECLDEVEANVDQGRIPKYSFKSLLSMSADIATILPIVYALAKLLGVPLP